MPSLASRPNSSLVKLLVIGDSGSGKTGALASLARAGLRVIIADFDNGVQILKSLLSPAEQEHVFVQTFQDERKPAVQSVTIGKEDQMAWGPIATKSTAYPLFIKALQNWEDLGSVNSWGSDTVLVIDSGTMMGSAILDYILFMQNRLGQHAQIQEIGYAMDKEESTISMLTSSHIKCHVIFNYHIRYFGGGGAVREKKAGSETGRIIEYDSDELGRGFPSALGRKLPPKVPRYFNSVLKLEARPSGIRAFSAIPTEQIALVKTIIPKSMPRELPLENGLAIFFELVQKATTNEGAK